MKDNGLKNYVAPIIAVRLFTGEEAIRTSSEVTDEIAVEWDGSWDGEVYG